MRIAPQHLDDLVYAHHFAFQRQCSRRAYVHAFSAPDALAPVHTAQIFRPNCTLPARLHAFPAPDAFLLVIHHIRFDPLRFRIAAPLTSEHTAFQKHNGTDSRTVVSHETGTAVVTLSADVANETLKKAVEDQDYKVTGIE